MAIEFYRNKHGRNTSYTAINTDTTIDDYGLPVHKTADVVVKHTEPTYIRHTYDDGSYTIEYMKHKYYHDESLPSETKKTIDTALWGRDVQPQLDSFEKLQNDPHMQPDTLFSEEGKHSTVVDFMAADPSMRTHALTLGALAHQDNPTMPLVASSDLSKHSSKLMHHLTQAGFPIEAHKMNSDMAQTNLMDFDDRTKSPSERRTLMFNAERISPTEVSQAQSTIRNTIKAGRKKRNTQPTTSKGLSDQFLPGMEGFV